MAKVIKRNGKKQQFLPAKVKRGIEKAAREVKLSPKRVNALVVQVAHPVVEYVKDKEEIRAVDLRKLILGRIERREKKVAKAWKRFDKKRH